MRRPHLSHPHLIGYTFNSFKEVAYIYRLLTYVTYLLSDTCVSSCPFEQQQSEKRLKLIDFGFTSTPTPKTASSITLQRTQISRELKTKDLKSICFKVTVVIVFFDMPSGTCDVDLCPLTCAGTFLASDV